MLNVWQLSSGHSIFTWARMWESIRGHFAKPKAVRGAKQFGGRCCVRWVVRSLLWQCLKLVQRTAVQCNVTPGCVQGKQVWATSSLVPWCQLASSTPIHTDTTPNTIRSVVIIYVRRVTVVRSTIIRWRIQVHEGKLCYNRDLAFVVNLLKYIDYYTQ